MAGMDWFRWHHGSVTDPKFQLVARRSGASLPDVLSVWAYLLESASQSEDRGAFGAVDCEAVDCLFNFPNTETRTSDILLALEERKLISEGRISAWEKRQPKRERDDDSADRVRKFRERQKEQSNGNKDDVTPSNAKPNQETPRVDKSREEERKDSDSPSDNSNVGGASPSAQPKKSNRGTRLPEDWKLPVDWGEWAMEEVPGLTRADVKKEAAKFRDHWHSKPGKDGVKLEWEATWRNWMRSDLIKPSGKAPAAQSDTWFMNSTGITEKGAERGIVQGEGELFPYFKDRVYAEFGITEEMVRKARADQNG